MNGMGPFVRSCLAAYVMAAGAASGMPPLDAPERPFDEYIESIAVSAERAQAHARMPDTMYASTPSGQKSYYSHSTPPATSGNALPDGRSSSAAAAWHGVANDGGESAETVFRQRISDPVVQSKCVRCHVSDGVSAHTRLVFVPASQGGHVSHNFGVFEDLLTVATDGDALILDKIKGARAHGGGAQIAASSALYADMQRFLELLGDSDNSVVTAETLFDTVGRRTARKTLYQAAIILAGRIPTDAEYASLGGWAALRAAVRGLMEGPGFHEFLIRAANDRLLTDTGQVGFSVRFANSHNESYRLIKEGGGSWRRYWHFYDGANYGLQRAPLELIAHVVENDLPYTEVLTADYVMANPAAAVAYGFKPTFEETDDIHDFQPARVVGLYRGNFVWGERDESGNRRIVDPGVAVDYPHAGILNTVSLLYRHPTTPTNRNRARARWTYYHFLGIDIERLGRRAIDIDALADERNPTMNNSACTSCHALLDPVAGTFQNYGEYGLYREGDAWFLDMRRPGFNGQAAPNASNSLEWLGEEIAKDERFAEATVKFWWPAVMGSDVAMPPTNRYDADFEGALLAAEYQNAEVQRLARMFRGGIRGGEPYNLKDLLTELVVSKWFMAEHLADTDPLRRTALQTAGATRPLTPEELVAKTEALTGFTWGRKRHSTGPERDRPLGYVAGEYRVLYGGIDSQDATRRHRAFTVPMALVAKRHAMDTAIAVVARDFFLVPKDERRLFGGIELDETPETAPGAIKDKLVELHGKLFGLQTKTASTDVLDAYRFFVDVWRQQADPWQGNRPGIRGWYSGGQHDHRYLEGIFDEALREDISLFYWDVGTLHDWLEEITTTEEEMRMMEAWGMMLAVMLMDYRYLHL